MGIMIPIRCIGYDYTAYATTTTTKVVIMAITYLYNANSLCVSRNKAKKRRLVFIMDKPWNWHTNFQNAWLKR